MRPDDMFGRRVDEIPVVDVLCVREIRIMHALLRERVASAVVADENE